MVNRVGKIPRDCSTVGDLLTPGTGTTIHRFCTQFSVLLSERDGTNSNNLTQQNTLTWLSDMLLSV